MCIVHSFLSSATHHTRNVLLNSLQYSIDMPKNILYFSNKNHRILFLPDVFDFLPNFGEFLQKEALFLLKSVDF